MINYLEMGQPIVSVKKEIVYINIIYVIKIQVHSIILFPKMYFKNKVKLH